MKNLLLLIETLLDLIKKKESYPNMFVLRNWDYGLDDKITGIIERDGKTYFYALEKELGVSRDTLNDHLKTMEQQEIIKKDEVLGERGKKYVRLTLKTIQEKKRGIFEGIKRVKSNKNTIVTEKRILTMFILSNAMLGFQLKKSSTTRVGGIPSVKGHGRYSLRSVEGTKSSLII